MAMNNDGISTDNVSRPVNVDPIASWTDEDVGWRMFGIQCEYDVSIGMQNMSISNGRASADPQQAQSDSGIRYQAYGSMHQGPDAVFPHGGVDPDQAIRGVQITSGVDVSDVPIGGVNATTLNLGQSGVLPNSLRISY